MSGALPSWGIAFPESCGVSGASRGVCLWGRFLTLWSRFSLIQLEGFLSGLCYNCEAVYRVLYWENPTVSSQ